MTRLSSLLLDNARRVGVAGVVLVLIAGVALFNRPELATRLSSTEDVRVHLDRDHNLAPYSTSVKVAGVEVGVVTDVVRGEDAVEVTLAVDAGTRDLLGTEPTAAVRPVTLLGGNVYVALSRGGEGGAFEGAIPVERTSTPVELDHVLATLQPDALDGAGTSARELDEAMRSGGAEALDRLVTAAPDTLRPTASAFDALLGEGGSDLERLVAEFGAIAATLTDDPQLLEDTVGATGRTARVLGETAAAQARALEGLPDTLVATRLMLSDLDGSMAELRTVAEPLRPSVTQLREVLERTTPVLADARPLVADLAPTVRDARPVVGDLDPTIRDLGRVVHDVRGPVLARLEDDLVPALISNYRGEPSVLYEEIGYLLAGMAGTAKYNDGFGAALSFQLGIGFGTLPPVGGSALSGDVDPRPEDTTLGRQR
ncbi:MlaD family protein [Nitriliruptor alkaliphilus]|uniref:MlaD family protein n=1 Tax=Nitriliruptor alkaliphilus TaxID=427918 RepID=UPI0012EEE046|nr:MlaD family protein [Nitriliruptor alkaliphilus]